MRGWMRTMRRYAPWLAVLASVDGFAALLIWLCNRAAFPGLVGAIVLASLVLFGAVCWACELRERHRDELLEAFLAQMDAPNARRFLDAAAPGERERLERLIDALESSQERLRQDQQSLRDYQEYVEGWAHEAKTPLSLLSLVLDNRAGQLPAELRERLGYVRAQLQEDVSQMLYYARLGSATKDYRFEEVDLEDAAAEVLDDYAPLLEQAGFVVRSQLEGERVYTDRRGLQFMLGQLVGNAVKYCGVEDGRTPELTLRLEHEAQTDVLVVADNGMGVKAHDLPYIFQKGFTGDSGDTRRKATGMGLYLLKHMADDLNLTVEATSRWGEGLTVAIGFPRVWNAGTEECSN